MIGPLNVGVKVSSYPLKAQFNVSRNSHKPRENHPTVIWFIN